MDNINRINNIIVCSQAEHKEIHDAYKMIHKPQYEDIVMLFKGIKRRNSEV